MENEKGSKKFDSVYSNRVRAGRRRTYFFDVKQTKGEDYYITLTESTKRFDGNGYERHKIFLYKEDFNRFLESLDKTIKHVKTELMPDYDYDEYSRKNKEWEERRMKEQQEESVSASSQSNSTPEQSDGTAETEEDISW